MTRQSALAIGSFGLGLGAFVFVSTELLPIGLLSQIAISFHAGLAATGYLVTLYAFTVALALAAVPITALTSRLPRTHPLFVLGLSCGGCRNYNKGDRLNAVWLGTSAPG